MPPFWFISAYSKPKQVTLPLFYCINVNHRPAPGMQEDMNKKKQGIDIIDKILDACYAHNPNKLFIMSLMHQYEERGSLSKKQLQGLFQVAQKVKDLPAAWLATLEATLLKMPDRFKSSIHESTTASDDSKRMQAGDTIEAILARYPQHKRVLFLRAKYEKQEQLTTAEMEELEKFKRLLLK